MARMGLIQKYDFKIGEKKMRILKFFVFYICGATGRILFVEE